MANNRGYARAFLRPRWIAVAAGSVGCLLGLAGAADAPLGSSFDATLPPSFSASQTAAVANIFTSCMNLQPALAGLGDAAQGKSPSSGISINTVCPEPPSSFDAGRISCASLSTGGVFDPALLASMKDRLNATVAALSCKKGKIEAIRGELSCLTGQANILSQQIGSMSDSYSKNIKRMEQDVAKIKSAHDDRMGQDEEVLKRLGGDRDSGGTGLRALKQKTTDMIAAIPSEILKIKTDQTKAADQRKALTQQIQTRTMALASDCFTKRTNPSYRCEPNGPPVTAIQYAVCRLEQNQQIGDRGEIQNDAGTAAKAKANAQGLQSILDAIFSDAPKNPNMPANAQEQQAAATTPVTILTAADVENQYGDQLAKFDSMSSLPIHDFVMAQIGNCFKKATNTVEQEQTKAGSEIYRAAAAIKDFENQTSSMANDLMNKYSQNYVDVMSGLTQGNYPLDLSACKNAQPTTQANCLDNIRGVMEGILTGQTADSQVAMTIKATDSGLVPPQTRVINFSCSGLNGCISKLEAIHSNIGTEIKKLDAFKKDYVLQANQNVDTFTQNIANMMSAQSMALSSHLKELNTALAAMGVEGLINIRPVEGEPLQYDEDGLVKPPGNALKFIGSHMNPPMLDVTGDSFASALSGMSGGAKDIERHFADAKEAETKLSAEAAECTTKAIADKAEALQKSIAELNSQQCKQAGRYCSSGDGDRVSSLAAAINGIASGSLDASTAQTLSTSIKNACPGNEDAAGEISFNDSKCSAEQLRASKENATDDSIQKLQACKDKLQKNARQIRGSQCDGIFEGIQSRIDALAGAVKRGDGAAGAVH